MRLVEMSVTDIIPYPNNPRVNDEAVEAVAESIRQCSYIQPIIVDETRTVLAGHTRLKALRLLGVERCECLIIEGLTEEQKRKFRYLDNKTGEAAVWDLEKLEQELEGLDMGGLDFFNLTVGDFSVNIRGDFTGAIEYGADEFEDEEFKYECPECGFRFN